MFKKPWSLDSNTHQQHTVTTKLKHWKTKNKNILYKTNQIYFRLSFLRNMMSHVIHSHLDTTYQILQYVSRFENGTLSCNKWFNNITQNPVVGHSSLIIITWTALKSTDFIQTFFYLQQFHVYAPPISYTAINRKVFVCQTSQLQMTVTRSNLCLHASL